MSSATWRPPQALCLSQGMLDLDDSSSAGTSLRCSQIDAEQTVPLRHSVLWPDEPVSHVLLPEDASGWHYGAFVDSNPVPVAVISLFIDACPIDKPLNHRGENDDTHNRDVRFRKFACDPAYQVLLFSCACLFHTDCRQGRGIGTKLLLHAISVAGSELQGSVLWCDARDETRGWYERRGLEAFGDIFFKGPVKYIRMKLDIDTA
ncbi:Glucosamine 6-phosphate N-acetyltransferase [Mycena sanguinolenta]|uniref:Glucosamine 6-phosphate N-acetyltransferase n=1 Tax=Mycena sanguinolenta TaxID=230812 RepID=A0A8H6YEM0_9AGAR|nr:Glucosamine 6-phosphate N-acetyltransferase [Mycena sanguinolenta]